MGQRTAQIVVRCLALLATLGVCVLAVGCGGASSSTAKGTTILSATDRSKKSTDRTSPNNEKLGSTSSRAAPKGAPKPRNITRAAYISRADAICNRTDQRQAARYKTYQALHGEAESAEDEEEIVTQIGLPMIKVELRELRALGSPEGQENEVGAVLVVAERALASAEADPHLILNSQKNPFNLAESLAAGYGYKTCGLQ
jgi:hypothetical protein